MDPYDPQAFWTYLVLMKQVGGKDPFFWDNQL